MSSPCPGAQALSQGVLEIWSRPVFGSGVSPKHDHPLLSDVVGLGFGGQGGGTRKKMAWWSSGLPGKNWLEMMYEFL